MTELELLKLLSGVQSSYIQQADAFREGRLRIVRKKRPVVTNLPPLIRGMRTVYGLYHGQTSNSLSSIAQKHAKCKPYSVPFRKKSQQGLTFAPSYPLPGSSDNSQ